MKANDFRLVGYIGVVLGALLLSGGLFASSYYEVHTGLFNFSTVVYPYSQYAAGLVVSGLVLLVVGGVFLWRASQEVSSSVVSEVPKPPDF